MIIKTFFFKLGKLFSNKCIVKLFNYTNSLKKYICSGYYSKQFKYYGTNTIISSKIELKGGKYIHIGTNSYIGKRAVLTAWDYAKQKKYTPNIFIGNNVCIGDDVHITSINSITISDGCLIGKKVTITDNDHGHGNISECQILPIERELSTKGRVYIGENTWIADKVTIVSGVSIGKNCIIGANSVITKSFPDNCIIAGTPGKIIKKIDLHE